MAKESASAYNESEVIVTGYWQIQRKGEVAGRGTEKKRTIIK